MKRGGTPIAADSYHHYRNHTTAHVESPEHHILAVQAHRRHRPREQACRADDRAPLVLNSGRPTKHAHQDGFISEHGEAGER